MLKFYNTLTRKTEDFNPQDKNRVSLYSCGPTVHNFAHIGNFRANLFVDILKRTLRFFGFNPFHVMNITDVEDKIIKKSLETGMSINEYTEPYTKAFFKDLDTLRISHADIFPKATEHIQEMIKLISDLKEKGFTYEKGGSVYFNIEKFENYGKLAGIDRTELKAGTRGDADKYDKENAQDFVLWKAPKVEDEPSWDSPFGPGRPGWHLECSAMSMKYLGETIDIHCGGEDLVFPHHQNEIAQSEAATGKSFVRYWLHNAHLQMGSEKMSKSLGNFYTLSDLMEKDLDPVAIRYLLMSTHYRSPIIFSFEGIEQAGAAVMRLRDFKRRLEREKPEGGDVIKTKAIITAAETGFKEKISDDLNISGALGEIFTLVRNANALLDSGKFTEKGRKKALALLKDWDSILDVLTETNMIDINENEIEQLILKRNEARDAKNWEEADRIRDELIQKGIILEDSGQGTRWKLK